MKGASTIMCDHLSPNGLGNKPLRPKIIETISEGEETAAQFREEILQRLSSKTTDSVPASEEATAISWSKSLPMRILYEFNGIEYYEAITYYDPYYLYTEEKHLLDENSDNIIDLQLEQLQNRLTSLVESFSQESEQDGTINWKSQLSVNGICGTYSAALGAFSNLQTANKTASAVAGGRRCYLWLGSSLTNMTPNEVVEFLRDLSQEHMRPQDSVLIGVDTCQILEKVGAAYSDTSSAWKEYIYNGLKSTGRVIGDTKGVFTNSENWVYVARWDDRRKSHMRFVRSNTEMDLETLSKAQSYQAGITTPIKIEKSEHILVGESRKFKVEELEAMFDRAGLAVCRRWGDRSGHSDASLFLLKKGI
ncbi:histidine-specific methyltransferase [Xylaria sp. FL1777]|nr:histidine-specific methyltransferase [Xylaria sp. FL1777]